MKRKLIKFCGCGHCKRGMHTRLGGFKVRCAIRKNRHNAKAALKKGNEVTFTTGCEYTD